MATVIPNELLLELLQEWPVARLATWGKLSPHIVPIVFCLDGNALFSPVDGKAKSSTALQRLANVADNPHCSVLLDRYSDDWQQLWWVRLDGKAQVCHPQGAQLTGLVDLLEHKYPQYRKTAVTQGPPTFLRLQWDSVASWAQREFTRDIFSS